jgi:hypothetical protein
MRKFPLAAFYRDVDGQPIDMNRYFAAKAAGDSCRAYGIRDGAVVLAAGFDQTSGHLEPGQIVIINSVKEDGTRPHRFRCVESVDESGVVHFVASGRQFKPKPLSDILGTVKYVST